MGDKGRVCSTILPPGTLQTVLGGGDSYAGDMQSDGTCGQACPAAGSQDIPCTPRPGSSTPAFPCFGWAITAE